MHLSSVRELKSELLDRVGRGFGEAGVLELPRAPSPPAAPRPVAAQALTPGRSRPRVRVERGEAAAAGRRLFSLPRPIAAFGVAPVQGRERDFRLAVRIFRGRESQVRATLQKAKLPASELDLATGVDYRPRLTLRTGVSCGHYRITAGTLGGFVEDEEGTYILSNNHVLANRDDAWVGDPILHPGPIDIRRRFTVVGELERWIPLRSRRPRGFDAAIARVTDEVTRVSPRSYKGIGRIVPKAIANRYAVSEVVKLGRTTGLTRGRVSAYELDGVAIDYGTEEEPLMVTFDDQIEFVGDPPEGPFSQPGDSGSFIIDGDTKKPYALLYAGGPDAEGIDRTLGQLLSDVLDALRVSLVS